MPKWAADYAVAAEISEPIFNLVLEKFLALLRAQNQHVHRVSLGIFGSLTFEVQSLTISDLKDVALGGVVADLTATVQLTLLGFRFTMLFVIHDVEVNLPTTPAGLPQGIVVRVTPTLQVNVTFPGVSGLIGWLLNGVGRLMGAGVWLAFRLIRKVEIPIWELVDVFNALGLRFAPGSPNLAAQNAVPPSSLILASDFNLTDPLRGNPAQLAHFLPANTRLGAVIHERVTTAAVQIAFTKGWAPTQIRVGGWRIYVNSIGVRFEQDKVVAFGTLKAKRGNCWCRVKARITFSAAVQPRVVDTTPPNPDPKIEFTYDANINTHVSTSGMLVVLGVIMFTPVFLALTIAMSFLINIVLQRFLPYQTTWTQSGRSLTVTANGAAAGTLFSMTFPLQLQGQGTYSLSPFRQFALPGSPPQNPVTVDVDYTPESLSIQEDELRVAIDLK